jgi:hypothetical protein
MSSAGRKLSVIARQALDKGPVELAWLDSGTSLRIVQSEQLPARLD